LGTPALFLQKHCNLCLYQIAMPKNSFKPTIKERLLLDWKRARAQKARFEMHHFSLVKMMQM
jgi:hypothetical protein